MRDHVIILPSRYYLAKGMHVRNITAATLYGERRAKTVAKNHGGKAKRLTTEQLARIREKQDAIIAV